MTMTTMTTCDNVSMTSSRSPSLSSSGTNQKHTVAWGVGFFGVCLGGFGLGGWPKGGWSRGWPWRGWSFGGGLGGLV